MYVLVIKLKVKGRYIVVRSYIRISALPEHTQGGKEL